MKRAEQPIESVFVVLNPVAGSSSLDQVRQILQEVFDSHDVDYEVYETTGDENLSDIVHEAIHRGFDTVVAGGGDGTVSAVVHALVDHDARLGILPLGTANVLAAEFSIPKDIRAAIKVLLEDPQTIAVDVMQVNGRNYILQIDIGISSLMIRDTKREAKRRFGRAAYLWTAFTRLFGYEPRKFAITVDDEQVKVRASNIVVANGGTLGMAPFRWGPDIRADDGAINICVFSARRLYGYAILAWNTLTGQYQRDRGAYYFQAHKRICIESKDALPVQADGEIIGDTPVNITVLAHAAHVLVPSKAQEQLEQNKPVASTA